MNKRTALLTAVLGLLAGMVVLAADAPSAELNVLSDLFSRNQDGQVVVGVVGTYPILDYTYYDYDPETFVVDMADVDVSRLPKSLEVQSGGVRTVKVQAISQGKGRALAKLEIQKAYLSKCLVSTEGNRLLIKVVGGPGGPAAPAAPSSEAGTLRTPAPAPPAPAPAPAESPREATRLLGVAVSEDGSAVLIAADGTPKFKYFTMGGPARIVVDLYGIQKGKVPSVVSGAGDVEKVRVALLQSQPLVTRVVLDLKKPLKPASVLAEGTQLRVVLNETPLEAAREPEAPAGTPEKAASAEQAQALPAPPETPAPAPEAAAAPAPEEQAQAPTAPKAAASPAAPETLDNVKVDLSPLSPGGSREFKGYEDLFVAEDTSAPAAEGKTLVAGGVPLSFKEKTISGGGAKYTGEPISMSLKDADIKDVLRVFHDISKLNIVVHPAVSGKVTVDLENVPWDQAMDIVLKNNGLDYVYENNVIWVAQAQEIARKFAEQQRMQKEKLLAEEPVTFTKRLSYAKAQRMETIAQKFLSERGSIIIDERTNTLIIQEVPSKKAGLLKLIESLDTATPQVLIEARIVESNITWTQSFGITWSGNWYTGMDNAGKVITTQGGTTGSGPAGVYSLHNFRNQTGFPNFGTGDFAVSLPPTASNGFIDLVLGNVTGSFFLDVRLAALENTGRARVLSAPRVVTQDNEKASIESGRQIPIRVATTDKISVIFVNATLKLDVTPQISADGNVNMTVDITNDSVDFANAEPGNPPPIIKKEAKTVLKVRDGQTAVIGGVFVTNEGISQNGLPFFSKIPVLGWLFKNRSKTKTNDELLIFLTPKIVR
ncbi:MAG: type IV pilus secretin PilQ [Acidobacteriota bacterium]